MPQQPALVASPARRRPTAGVSLLVAGVLAAAGLSVGTSAARAAEPGGSAPIATPDTVTMTQYEGAVVDVLENDTDADGDRLDICRLGKIPEGLAVDQITNDGSTGHVIITTETQSASASPAKSAGSRQGRKATKLYVSAMGKPGTYTVTYYACDYSYLTPGTLTVEVKAPPRIKVKVTKLDTRPGRLKVTNTSGFPVRFAWGSISADDADGMVTVTRKPVVITVNRPSIFWAAFNKRTPFAKFGAVRHIPLPAGKHLPPGAPSPAVMDDLRTSTPAPTLAGRWAARLDLE